MTTCCEATLMVITCVAGLAQPQTPAAALRRVLVSAYKDGACHDCRKDLFRLEEEVIDRAPIGRVREAISEAFASTMERV